MFVGLLLIVLSLGWAKSCKPAEYEFKQYGVTHYGWGAKKGCFAGDYAWNARKKAEEKVEAEECSVIKKGGKTKLFGEIDFTDWEDEDLEDFCNFEVGSTCVWKGGKCKAASCPVIKTKSRCGGKFKNGKCEKLTGDECVYHNNDQIFIPTPNNANCSSYMGTPAYTCPEDHYCREPYGGTTTFYCYTYERVVPCSKLSDYYYSESSGSMGDTYVKFTADDKKICQYECEHPSYEIESYGPYEYTKHMRKAYHKQLGCLYAEGGCSTWSIWAFVLTLVILILVVVGTVVFVVVAHFFLKLF